MACARSPAFPGCSVAVEIKFCGMTRAEDVEAAVRLGASYVGVIFAESPRRVTSEAARAVLRAVPESVGRVGVFGPDVPPEAAAETARAVGLSVLQLHGDPDMALVRRARKTFDGQVWAVVRVAGHQLPEETAALFDIADAVVIDAYSPTALGGTGRALPWSSLAAALAAYRRRARLVLAGGLRPENVAAAIAALDPDVVDVSSGVESEPGVKDHSKLRAFRDAVAGEEDR